MVQISSLNVVWGSWSQHSQLVLMIWHQTCKINISSSGSSRFILLLGSVLENLGKLIVVKHSLLDRCLLVHLINLIIGEPVTDGGQELSQSVLVKHSDVVFIKTSKCVLDNILGVCALKPFSKHCQEHGEVDWSWSFSHHSFQIVLGRILAKTGQHVVEILVINEPISVLVNHVESLLELLDLILIEHSKDITGRSLGPLLGGASATCCFTGGHFWLVFVSSLVEVNQAIL